MRKKILVSLLSFVMLLVFSVPVYALSGNYYWGTKNSYFEIGVDLSNNHVVYQTLVNGFRTDSCAFYGYYSFSGTSGAYNKGIYDANFVLPTGETESLQFTVNGLHYNSSVTNPNSDVVIPVPSAPTGLSISGSDVSGKLSWIANPSSEDVISYSVYKNGTFLATTTTNSYSYSNLGVGTSTFTVSAANSSGSSPQSSGVSLTFTLPSAPSGLSISGSGGSGRLSWTQNPSVENVTSYNVFLDGSLIKTVSDNYYDFKGLPVGSHLFTVSAHSSIGDSSQSSSISYILLASPGIVTGLTVSGAGANHGLLTWDALPSDQQVSSYNVYDSNSFFGTTSANSFAFSNLSAGQHNFQVSGINSSGEGPKSDIVQYTVVSVPSQVNLSYFNLTSNSVDLKWSSLGSGVSYAISVNGNVVANLVDPSNTYHVSNLMPSQSYSISVVASNFSGTGQSSDINIVTLMPLPSVPSGLKFDSSVNGSVVLSWNDNSSEDHVTKYNIYQNGVFLQSATSNTATISGLSNGQSYNFSVSALNSGGESGKSSAVSVTSTQQATSTKDFPQGAVSLGVDLRDIFDGIKILLFQLWPIIALGIVVFLAFKLGRKTKLFGQKISKDSGLGGNGQANGSRTRTGFRGKKYFGNKTVHYQNRKGKQVLLARRSTRKTRTGKRLTRRPMKYGVKKVTNVNQKRRQWQRKHKLNYLTKSPYRKKSSSRSFNSFKNKNYSSRKYGSYKSLIRRAIPRSKPAVNLDIRSRRMRFMKG